MIDDRNLHSQLYYDSNETIYVNETVIRTFGSTSTFCRASLTLLLRAGFILIQIGCTPVNDVQMILLQNIVDIASGTVTYCIVGYILSFGHDASGLIGRESWIISDDVDMNNAVLGWSAVITATAIFTTMVAGRMHCIGYVIVTILFSMFVQPTFMHWAWSRSGWMHKSSMSDHKVSFKDQAGGSLVHVTGGILALFGGLFLGRRILLLRDIDECSLPPSSPGNVVTGYVFLIIGLMGFCLPTPTYERTHFPADYIGLTVINNVMALAGGIISVIILQLILARNNFDYWIIIRCMQGAIAGMVTVAAGIDVYKPLVAFGLSVAGALLFFFAARQSFSSSVEDYANLIPVHLVCGFFGTFLPPLCGSSENLGKRHNIFIHFGWQVMCNFIILAAIILFSLIIFLILHCFGFLRNKSEERNHVLALIALEDRPRRNFLQRIFSLDKDYQPYLQPGYCTKHEANFIDENCEQLTSKTSSLATKSYSTSDLNSNLKNNHTLPIKAKSDSTFDLKFNLKSHSTLPTTPKDLNVPPVASEIYEEEIQKPDIIEENANLLNSFLITENRRKLKKFQDVKRNSQFSIVHSTNDEKPERSDYVGNIKEQYAELTKANTDPEDDGSETEIIRINYRKYKPSLSCDKYQPMRNIVPCLSRITGILNEKYNSHFHLSAHNIGEGDCIRFKQHIGKASHATQQSLSASHLPDTASQDINNSVKKIEKEVYKIESYEGANNNGKDSFISDYLNNAIAGINLENSSDSDSDSETNLFRSSQSDLPIIVPTIQTDEDVHFRNTISTNQ